jgi:hypothetical protein
MNKISNAIVYSIIFNRGLLPSVDREYEDERMKQAVIELNELRKKEAEIYKTISSLFPFEYELYIYTDDDYVVDIKDSSISSSGRVYFHSIEELDNCVKEARITPDDDFLRVILVQAVETIKQGEDFSFNGNQIVELYKV